jgi:hypothetical protein
VTIRAENLRAGDTITWSICGHPMRLPVDSATVKGRRVIVRSDNVKLVYRRGDAVQIKDR